MANRFVLNETSYHGPGAIQEIAGEVKGRGFKKCFVCSDPDLIKFNVTKKVTDVLENAGIDYEIYSKIKANPTVENVQTGVAAFKASGADCIIAIGGGSSMDTAKAIGIIIENPEFSDVISLEGAHHQEGRADHRRSHHCRYSRRGHHQLCDHRHGEKPQNGMRRCARHSRSGRCGPGDDGLHAQGADRRHRYGRTDPRH